MSPDTDPAALEAEVERLREEKAALERELGAQTHRSPAGRRVAAIALIVVGAILIPIAILGVWTRNQISDTDRYVQTVTPLASDPDIQAVAADRITQALLTRVDVDQLVEDALPEESQVLAGPLTAAIETFVRQATTTVLESDQFQQAWVAANRFAHTQMVAVLTGEGSAAIKTDDGSVLLDLSGVAGVVSQRLAEAGIDWFSSVDIPEGTVTVEIFRSDDITRAQVAFDAFDTLATVLPWIALVLLAAGVLVMPDRRRGLVWAGAAASVTTLLLLLGLTIGRSIYLAAIPSDVLPQDAAAAFFDTILRFLRQSARAVLAVALVVFLAAVIVGPTDAAVRFRAFVRRLLGRVGDEADERGIDFGPVGSFVHHNLMALRIATGVVAVLALLAWEQPGAATVLGIVLAALVVLGVLEVLGRAPVGGAGAGAGGSPG